MESMLALPLGSAPTNRGKRSIQSMSWVTLLPVLMLPLILKGVLSSFSDRPLYEPQVDTFFGFTTAALQLAALSAPAPT